MAAVTIVVPVHNEVANLGAVLPLFVPVAGSCELLFVDDGSTDGTAARIEDAGYRVIRLFERRGFGGAVQEGLRTSSGDVVVWMPGNGRVDPLVALSAGLLLTRSDPGQRWFVKATRHGRPRRDRVTSLLAGALVSLVAGCNLFENGGTPTAVHRRHIDLLLGGPDDLLFEVFTLWRLQRAGLVRIRFPVRFGRRLAGRSRWNHGLISQLRLLRRQLATVRSWRIHCGAIVANART